MYSRIKKFLSFLFKEKILFPVFFFVLFGLFFFPRPVFAVWDWLVGAITLIPAVSIALIALVAGSIASLLAALGGVILNYVISDSFTTLSYTNPANNELIRVGLGITQGFVNMLLVLILVYIAIATILRLAGYETKKLLVTFIVVALLVNFAPVICGLIVDASNIVMNFFLRELTGGKQLINSFGAIWETLKTSFGDWKIFKVTGQIDIIVQFTVLTVLNLVLFLVLLLFASIFMFRYIAIWMLVILSPLAFACYILPVTKKYWEMWWTQFIQWSIIGITCGFFLYLAELLASMGTGLYGTASGLGSSFLPHLVPLGFLFMGLVFGLKTSAMGASTIMSLTKKSGAWVGGKTVKGIAAGTRKWIPSLPKKDEKAKWYQRKFALTSPTKAAGAITKAWERIPFVKWYRPEALRRYADVRQRIEDAKKRISGPSGQVIRRVITGFYKGPEAAAAVDAVVRDRGDSQDFIKEYMKEYGIDPKEEGAEKKLLENEKFLKDKHAMSALDLINQAGNLGKIERIDPRLAKIGRSKKEGRDKMIEAISNAKPADVGNWEREVPENEEVMEAALAIGDDDFFRALGRLKGKVLARQRTIDNIFSKWVEDNKRDATKNKENWKAFMESLQKKYNVLTPGIAKALTNERFRSAGWGYMKELNSGAKYLSEPERVKPLGYGGGFGAALEAEAEEKPSGPPPAVDTGEAQKRKRKEPDVGK